MGAAVLAGFALLLTPAELDLALKDIFVSSRGFKRRTFPRYALLDHVEFDKALQRQCRGAQIEDVWLPYFAVATDVDRAGQSLYVMRRGELWKAVRASGSIPACCRPCLPTACGQAYPALKAVFANKRTWRTNRAESPQVEPFGLPRPSSLQRA